MKTVDLEKLTPQQLAELAMASTLRSGLTSPPSRAMISFWTARKMKGNRVVVLGYRITARTSNYRPKDAAKRPSDATEYVRVWTGDVWAWLTKHHPTVARAVEVAAAEMMHVVGAPPAESEGVPEMNRWKARMRDKVEEVSRLLEAHALEELKAEPQTEERA